VTGASTQPRLVSGDGGPALLLRAALPAIPVVNRLPGIRKTGAYAGLSVAREPVTVEPGPVAAYAEVCGFTAADPVAGPVPLPYLHLLAFPLHMAMMTDPAFPVPAMGMVHLENSITRHRAVGIGETVSASASVGLPVPHPVGMAYRFTTEVRAGDAVVWESASTYLRRGRRDPDAVWPSELVDVPPSGPVFTLRSDLGRRYARVSGDYNPIHLTTVTAKALGFPRHIAHGMWTLARCVAAMDNRLPEAVRVDVAFKKPVLLPGAVAYGSRPVEGGYAFSLHKRGSDALHLLGRTTAL